MPDSSFVEEAPPVADLLDVDWEYRAHGSGGTLGTTRGPRRYIAAFSDSPLAQRFRRTHDWVVLRYENTGGGGAGHSTVITARLGPMKGRRVVRGREVECFAYYRGRVGSRGPRRAARFRAAPSAA